MNKVLLGCMVGIITLATQSIGLTLQRKSHIIEAKVQAESIKPLYKRKLWQFGCFLFIISNVVGSSIQISTLPLIILSPLQAIGLIFNSICGFLILGEIFNYYTLIGTILVSFGAFFIGYFGSIPEPNHNLQELLELLKRFEFVVWFTFTLGLLVVIRLYILFLSHEHPLLESSRFSLDLFKGILFGAICGILSATALLLAKSAVELLLMAILAHDIRDLKNYQSWLIISGWIFCAVFQVFYLNLGLEVISSSIIFPLIFCVYNLFNIVNSLVYYNQLNKLNFLQIAMIFIGIFLILVGVFYLSLNDIIAHRQQDTEMIVEQLETQPLNIASDTDSIAYNYDSINNDSNDSLRVNTNADSSKFFKQNSNDNTYVDNNDSNTANLYKDSALSFTSVTSPLSTIISPRDHSNFEDV